MENNIELLRIISARDANENEMKIYGMGLPGGLSEDERRETREEAIRRAMSVSDEDIDYSDIPPIELREGVRVVPVGNKFREMAKRNLAALNNLLREN